MKGLITEASPLTYPEDSSLDELNTLPTRKGNRTRRFGINYNSGNATPRIYDPAEAKSEYMWSAVGGNAGLTFLVVQNGNDVSFYDRSSDGFADTIKNFRVNLAAYTRPGVTTASATRCTFAAGKGYLFIVQQDIEPLVITYDVTSDSITVTPIVILARDFDGLNDGLQNDEEPAQLTSSHFYNLLNQGWVTPKT